MKRFLHLPLLVLSLGLFMSGCASKAPLTPNHPTMNAISYLFHEGIQQDTLLVMLPGINNSPSAFSANGLVAEAQKAGLVDVLAVDANYKFYMDHSIVIRLNEDIIVPAKASGYRHIWLVGASMGGFGTLLYAQAHPMDIDGIVLLAPFLGQGSLQKELESSGGLANWHYKAGSGKDDQDRKVREIWFWLQQRFSGKPIAPADNPNLAIWAGCGQDDKFRADFDSISAIMPSLQTVSISGSHDWKTWKSLFQRIVHQLKIKTE